MEKKVSIDTDKAVVLVRDNIEALHLLTKYYINILDIPIIALTGSSGKTTTKDLIASVLSQKYRVHKTVGNQNNHLGVPLTIFGIERETEIAVIEMGMNHSGEIHTLANLVEPDIAIITNVGLTHIEHLKTQENIFKAKSEILETLNKNQIALLNGDDSYLSKVKNQKFRVINFGAKISNDIHADDIMSNYNGLRFTAIYDGFSERYYFRYPGIHNVYNCLVAIYLGKHFELSQEDIQRGLDKYIPSENRMEIRDINGYKVINDSYNANPDSMKAAIKSLIDYKTKKGRTFAVLGDMLEMGDNVVNYHREIGSFVAKLKKVDYLISVGNYSKFYNAGAKESGMSTDNLHYFTNNQSTASYLKKILKPDDIILIKGSRGMLMEEILLSLERS